MFSLTVTTFNLDHTLNSGQLFRFSKHDEWYYLVQGNTIFKIKQKDTTLYFDNVSQEFIARLFCLHEDYEHILSEIAKDAFMQSVIKQYSGLRVTRQDPWECSISFICASASNIKKIQYCLNELSKSYGTLLSLDHVAMHSFPPFKSLTDAQKIRRAKTGFRAKYLYRANEKITVRFLREIQKMPYDGAKKALMQLDGIGEKIADCILLFSFGCYEAFPVDVWIKRIVEQQYLHQPTSEKKIAAFGRSYFGRYAGIAQQYLYFYALQHAHEF